MSSGDAWTPSGLAKAVMFADRFWCVMTTPFGVAVEPDVNCTNAMSLVVGAVPGSIAGPCSASNATTIDRSGHIARSASTCGRSVVEVTTARAPHERRTRPVASKYDGRSLVAVGGYNDAGTTPARDVPERVGRKASGSGTMTATRSPGRSPRPA